MSEDNIEILHRRLDAQDAILGRIERAIIGDEQMGHRGIATRLSRAESKINSHDKKLLLWGGIVTGASFAAGALRDFLIRK